MRAWQPQSKPYRTATVARSREDVHVGRRGVLERLPEGTLAHLKIELAAGGGVKNDGETV